MNQLLPSPFSSLSGNGAVAGRRNITRASLLLLTTALLGQQAQAQTVLRVGTGGTYATISSALAAVPTPLTGAYELQLTSGSTFAENVLINKVGSAANSLTIKPEAGATNIIINGTLSIAGASYVTINGHNGAVTRQISLRQNSTSLPALAFRQDAQNNTVRDLEILGNNAQTVGGVVEFSGAVSGGNDNNALIKNYLGNGSGGTLPANLVYASGIASALNDQIALLNNEFANYALTGVVVAGGNGSGWNIRDNSFYYSLPMPLTTAQTAVNFSPGAGSDSNVISGNYIGGSAALAAGSTWQNSGSQDFNGIVVNCGTATGTSANLIENNTVRNINLSSASNQAFKAMQVVGGRTELTSNAVSNVTNNGTNGVNALVSQAQTILSSYTVPFGQVMSIQAGEMLVLGNLTMVGTINHTGGDIVVNGDFNISSTGAFSQTLGNLEIKGNMSNLGVFSCTTGGVLLTGTGPQTVSGGLYYNLEVRGGSTKTLTGDMTLANNLTMTDGILDTDYNQITLNEAAQLSENASSYVLGTVKTTPRTMQVGNTQAFSNIGLKLTPAAASALPSSVRVTRVTGTAVNTGSGQSIKRTFNIVAPGAPATGMNMEMRIEYLPYELGALDAAKLKFFKSSDNGATWVNKGTTTNGAGYATLSSVDGFSIWTLGAVPVVLPVTLTDFRAQRQGHEAVLTWATATERNNRGYGVEVSTDGKTFRSIGFVAASEGGATTSRTYRFVDSEGSKQGVRYYRLRQEDFDGKTSFFGPRTVSFDERAGLAAYPTRFDQNLNVDLGVEAAGTATLTLHDALGRVVWTKEETLGAGLTHLEIQPTCPAGTYVLTATVNGHRFQQRVVRQ